MRPGLEDTNQPCPFCGQRQEMWTRGVHWLLWVDTLGTLIGRQEQEVRIAAAEGDRTGRSRAIIRPYRVECWNCGARGPIAENRERAVELWNALTPAAKKRRAQLGRAIKALGELAADATNTELPKRKPDRLDGIELEPD